MDLLETLKNDNYFEETIPQYTGQQYQEHFRLTKEKTVDLAERFRHSEYFHHQQVDSQKISPLKCSP